MKQTITKEQFRNAFQQSSERKDQFSYKALGALFDYIEGWESDSNEELEFDMIALCCEYCEYKTNVECAIDYGWSEEDLSSDDAENTAYDWLVDQTSVIKFDGGIIVASF